jgi:hypothetical protein
MPLGIARGMPIAGRARSASRAPRQGDRESVSASDGCCGAGSGVTGAGTAR